MRLRTRSFPLATCLCFSVAWLALPAGCSSDDGGSEKKSANDAGSDADAADGDAGTDAGPAGGPPGSACWVDADCKDGVCWTPKAEGLPGGYCVIEGCTQNSCPTGSSCVSFNDGVDRCVASCTTNADCREAEGYECDSKNVCWPGVGTIPPGGSCGADEQCMGADALCIQQVGFVGGYCVITKCTDTSCPTGSECRPIFTSGASACIPVYTDGKGCRPGYQWVETADSKWLHSCYPGCATDADCPGDFGCREGAKSLICLDVSNECSPKNQHGDCPEGQVCSGGACAPFVCNDTVMEPNQSQSAALAMPTKDTSGLQICLGDNDWFSLTPSQAKTLYLVGIDSNHASGDLQVDLTDSAGVVSNDASMDPAFYHSEGSVGPTNLELHALLGVPGSAKSFLHVHGVGGLAENNYALVSRSLSYEDGPDCGALFSTAECVALNTQGSHDPSKLIVFPLANPADPYVGAGIFFKNGLSAFGNPPYTSSARHWARREVIMAVRYAIHSVQQAFPGTAPLSIGDIGMPDGTTPEGHPNGTHYFGANMDVSYYIRPDVAGADGNLVYRQICCDAPLKDWSCVDTNTSSASYGVCVAGSEKTHIVDLPRTAMFIAKLAGTGRIRVIGTEAKVEAGLEAEMDNLLGKGLLSANEHSVGKAVMVTANDDGSWIWHFNHLHVSFKTDPSPLPSGSRGLWPDLPKGEQSARARAFPRRVPDAASPTGSVLKIGQPVKQSAGPRKR